MRDASNNWGGGSGSLDLHTSNPNVHPTSHAIRLLCAVRRRGGRQLCRAGLLLVFSLHPLHRSSPNHRHGAAAVRPRTSRAVQTVRTPAGAGTGEADVRHHGPGTPQVRADGACELSSPVSAPKAVPSPPPFTSLTQSASRACIRRGSGHSTREICAGFWRWECRDTPSF